MSATIALILVSVGLLLLAFGFAVKLNAVHDTVNDLHKDMCERQEKEKRENEDIKEYKEAISVLLEENMEYRNALNRLGSMEAFYIAGVVSQTRDAELMARIEYARRIIEQVKDKRRNS